MVKEIGFFEKTKFHDISVYLSVVACHTYMPNHKITLRVYKRISLITDQVIHRDEFIEGVKNNAMLFYIKHAAHILLSVCKKYKLDSNPIERLLQTHGCIPLESNGSSSDVEVSETDQEELYIYAKVGDGDDEFASNEDIAAVAQLIDSVDNILEEAGIGHVSGSETQGPYMGTSCMGPDCRVMYERLSKQLQAVAGSFVELRYDDKTERIKVGQ